MSYVHTCVPALVIVYVLLSLRELVYLNITYDVQWV